MSLNKLVESQGKVTKISTKKRAGLLDLHIEQGALFEIPIVYKIDDEPVDLTGCIVRSQFRRAYDSAETIFDLTSENNSLEVIPEEGKIILKLLPSQTDNPKHLDGVWDMVIEFNPEKIIRLLTGKFYISKRVTR